MIKGITPNEEIIIKEILKLYPYSFYYYGSRVKGDFSKASDLDILIKSNSKIPISVIEEISLKFNQSKIPYIVNFVDYNNLDEKFYKLIEPLMVKVL